MIITIIVLAMAFLWKCHQSRIRLRMYREEHERRKADYAAYMEAKNSYVEVKEKLTRATSRPRLSNGKFTKK